MSTPPGKPLGMKREKTTDKQKRVLFRSAQRAKNRLAKDIDDVVKSIIGEEQYSELLQKSLHETVSFSTGPELFPPYFFQDEKVESPPKPKVEVKKSPPKPKVEVKKSPPKPKVEKTKEVVSQLEEVAPPRSSPKKIPSSFLIAPKATKRSSTAKKIPPIQSSSEKFFSSPNSRGSPSSPSSEDIIKRYKYLNATMSKPRSKV